MPSPTERLRKCRRSRRRSGGPWSRQRRRGLRRRIVPKSPRERQGKFQRLGCRENYETEALQAFQRSHSPRNRVDRPWMSTSNPTIVVRITAANPIANDFAGIPDMSATALARRFEQRIRELLGSRCSHSHRFRNRMFKLQKIAIKRVSCNQVACSPTLRGCGHAEAGSASASRTPTASFGEDEPRRIRMSSQNASKSVRSSVRPRLRAATCAKP